MATDESLPIVPPCPMSVRLTFWVPAAHCRVVICLPRPWVRWVLELRPGCKGANSTVVGQTQDVGTTWQVAYKYLQRDPLTAFRKWQELWWSILSRFGGDLRENATETLPIRLAGPPWLVSPAVAGYTCRATGQVSWWSDSRIQHCTPGTW